MSKPMEWLFSNRTLYKVVEIEKGSRLSIDKSDKNLQESVATLNSHPGFLYLLDRLKSQASLLKQKLTHEKHSTLQEVEFLQSGIFWCGWLQDQVNQAMKRPSPREVDPFEAEMEAFKAIDATIERVGNDE